MNVVYVAMYTIIMLAIFARMIQMISQKGSNSNLSMSWVATKECYEVERQRYNKEIRTHDLHALVRQKGTCIFGKDELKDVYSKSGQIFVKVYKEIVYISDDLQV